jgi:hypothetical protein
MKMNIPGLEIYLGSNNDARNIIHPTKVHNLIVHNLNHVEGIARGDRVDKNIAMYADCMLRVQY